MFSFPFLPSFFMHKYIQHLGFQTLVLRLHLFSLFEPLLVGRLFDIRVFIGASLVDKCIKTSTDGSKPWDGRCGLRRGKPRRQCAVNAKGSKSAFKGMQSETFLIRVWLFLCRIASSAELCKTLFYFFVQLFQVCPSINVF